MNILPQNPYKEREGRAETVKNRLIAGSLGSLCVYGGLRTYYASTFMSLSREISGFMVFAGTIVAGAAVCHEIYERFHGEQGGFGDRSTVDSPDKPDGGGSLAKEIEAYLQKQANDTVSV